MEFFRQSTELKRRGYRGELQTDAQAAKIVELTGIYLRPHFNTSEPHPEHEKFPYLLRKCKIKRPNQVWNTGITYTAGRWTSGIYDRNRRLVQSQSSCLQRSEYNGRLSLCRNVKNGNGFLRETGDFQFGSREPVHQFGVCSGTPGSWNSDQHGRAGTTFG